MATEIRLNAFDMNCVGHQSPGLWAHPRDRSDTYKDLGYWTALAKTLEASERGDAESSQAYLIARERGGRWRLEVGGLVHELHLRPCRPRQRHIEWAIALVQ